ITVATNPIWADISTHLNNQISKSALHTLVFKNWYCIKEKLGFPICSKTTTTKAIIDSPNPSESSDDSSYLDEDLPKKNLLNDKNRPKQSCRSHQVLQKNQWTPILAEHFWIHTQLPCCISFQRSYVYPHENHFITVIGRCFVCSSHFKGVILNQPSENARVLMECTYTGNFNVHHINKKRRIIGPAKEKAISSIVIKQLSSETFREKEANRLMTNGGFEPAIIPTGNCLRTLKSKKLVNERRNKDSLISLNLMKTENEFRDIIQNIGCDPFFVHYHSSEKINLYRSYCSITNYPKLVIDATGSIVKTFNRFGLKKTKSIYLYEALVYDKEKKNLLLQTCLLLKWISCDINKSKETICDNSLSLLSAIVQSFTQYSSLNDYVRVCSDLLTQEISSTSHWVPRCFVRIDVAHFKETACELHKRKLIEATASGFIEFQQESDNIIAHAESEDEARNLIEEMYEI
ncbi:hypothetical protein AGLY_017429, partial [Aphis glycines]